MANEDTWWNHQGATLTKPTVRLVAPRRGDFGGLCAYTACANGGADWYNRGTYAYSCETCARRINERCLLAEKHPVCELHR